MLQPYRYVLVAKINSFADEPEHYCSHLMLIYAKMVVMQHWPPIMTVDFLRSIIVVG